MSDPYRTTCAPTHDGWMPSEESVRHREALEIALGHVHYVHRVMDIAARVALRRTVEVEGAAVEAMKQAAMRAQEALMWTELAMKFAAQDEEYRNG